MDPAGTGLRATRHADLQSCRADAPIRATRHEQPPSSLYQIYFSHIKIVAMTLDKWWEWLLFACRYFIIRPALIVPELAPGATGVASANTKKQLIHSRHNCG